MPTTFAHPKTVAYKNGLEHRIFGATHQLFAKSGAAMTEQLPVTTPLLTPKYIAFVAGADGASMLSTFKALGIAHVAIGEPEGARPAPAARSK